MQEVRGDQRKAFKPGEKIIAGWADEIHGFYGWFQLDDGEQERVWEAQ